MNPALDKSASVDHVIPEHKVRCGFPQWQAGGGGINVSRVVRRLGGNPTAIFPVGGHCGRLLCTLLQEEGIQQRTVSISGTTRESLAVYEETTGQQYRFSFPGPTLEEDDWQGCLEAIRELTATSTYLVLSGGLPPGVPEDFYAQSARIGKDAGNRIILDATGAPFQHAMEEGVFLIKPNVRELGQFMGRELESEAEQRAVASKLIENGHCEAVVLSIGAAGVILATHEDCQHLRAPLVPIRSKVGAGDSTVGGIVWRLAQGDSLMEAVRYGVAAGSACVMTPGTELCYRKDVEQLYEAMIVSSQ